MNPDKVWASRLSMVVIYLISMHCILAKLLSLSKYTRLSPDFYASWVQGERNLILHKAGSKMILGKRENNRLDMIGKPPMQSLQRSTRLAVKVGEEYLAALFVQRQNFG